MPTEARLESVQFELPHEDQKNKKDKREGWMRVKDILPPLFSGWNWTACTFPLLTDAIKSTP